MPTRFFANGLTTGMTGSSIDPDLAATLAVADRRERQSRDHTTRPGSHGTSFSTLLHGSARRGPAPRAGWCAHLRRMLQRLAAG
jgi:hypothetical protein